MLKISSEKMKAASIPSGGGRQCWFVAGWVGGMEQEMHKQSPSSAQEIPGMVVPHPDQGIFGSDKNRLILHVPQIKA